MKRQIFIVLFFSIATLPMMVSAQDFTPVILQSIEIESDAGNPVDTYEEVKAITGIRAKFVDSGPYINQDYLDNKFATFAKDSTAVEFFDRLNRWGGLIYGDSPDFTSFMAAHFYLEAGWMPEDVWQADGRMTPKDNLDFDDYKRTDYPHNKSYFLCLDSAYQYIKPFAKPDPNAVSCEKFRDFCEYEPNGPCRRKVEEDDPDNPGEKIVIEPDKHDETVPNIHEELITAILEPDQLAPGNPMIENQSGMCFDLTFKDRTPPIINCQGGKFPELGKPPKFGEPPEFGMPSTTGDWYKVKGLKITDNSGGKIGTSILLGKIDTSPSITWESEEQWIVDKPCVIESGYDTDHIIMPNACHGFMNYTVYAWDRHGNLNPGEAKIHDDDPKHCYGLGNTVVGNVNVDFSGKLIDTDLSDDPNNARGWPIKVEFPNVENSDDTHIGEPTSTLNSDFRRGQGLINIRDNDLPNIVIRLESVKDRSRIFFPPITPTSDPDFRIIPSTKYKSSGPTKDMNTQDYIDFLLLDKDMPIESIDNINYQTSKLEDGSQDIYFRVIDIIPSPVMHPSEKDLLVSRYKTQPDSEFIRRHFRLECYEESDTRVSDGGPELDQETFGKRNSYGERVVALLELPGNLGMIQEDVEYLIDVWADDNIKWANIEGDKKLEEIIPIPSGIKTGNISVAVPNQYPPAHHRAVFDSQQSVNGGLRVVFREPTPDGDISDEKSLLDRKFPFVEVEAIDHAGFKRSIRLYLRITNENPNIRVIDRKHEKNRDPQE